MADTMHKPCLAEETPDVREAPWGQLIADEQWQVLQAGTEALEAAGVQFLLAGALALATYTGRWRNTKDIDVMVRAADRARAAED